MLQHKTGVPMINVKNRTKYDLQKKLKQFISYIFIHFRKSQIPETSQKKGQKFQSRDKIPKSESTDHKHISAKCILTWRYCDVTYVDILRAKNIWLHKEKVNAYYHKHVSAKCILTLKVLWCHTRWYIAHEEIHDQGLFMRKTNTRQLCDGVEYKI